MSSPRSYTPPRNHSDADAAAWEREAEVRTDGAFRYVVCPASAFERVDDTFFAFCDWAREQLGSAVSFRRSIDTFYLYPQDFAPMRLTDLLRKAQIGEPS